MTEKRDCPDCHVKPGQNRLPGCDVERCVLCGGQALSCGCVLADCGYPDYEGDPTDAMWSALDARIKAVGGPLVWTGIWPGEEEAIEFGYYSRWVNRKTGEPCEWSTKVPGRWQECKKDDPGAGPDLNRIGPPGLAWSREKRRWVKP